MHSTASDGAYAPARLMELAHARGLAAVALTDHDTTAGLDEARGRAEALGMEFVAGVEIEAERTRGVLHILGYFVDPGNVALAALLVRVRETRDARNAAIFERLAALGIRLDGAAIARGAGAALGRPHIAEALLRAGAARDYRAAFRDYLADGAAAHVPLARPSSAEIIAAVRAAGGAAALAHPTTLGCRASLELRTLVQRLRDEGLAAIETIHPSLAPGQRAELERLAARLDLATTGGSDFHALARRESRGVGFARERVPYDRLVALRMRACR